MDNKLKVVSVIAAAATGLLLYIYVKRSNRDQTHEEKLQAQLINLQKQINIKAPSYAEFKKVMEIGIRQAKLKLNIYSKTFRQKRKTYAKELGKGNFAQYMEFLYRSVLDMDRIGAEVLWEISRRIGLSEQTYERYEKEVENSLKQVMEGQNQSNEQQVKLSVEQAKSAVKKQIKLIREEGGNYVGRIVEVARDWPLNKRSTLPILLPTIIADAAFKDSENLDAEILWQAQVKHQYQLSLIAEFQELEFAMTPLMLKINAAVRQSTGKDLGDLPSEVGNSEELNELQKKQLSSYAEMAEMIEKSSK